MYRVLIADDEPWSRETVKRLGNWSDLGLQLVAETGDTSTTLRAIDEERPNIIVTDMRMPGIEPVQLLEQIAARPGAPQIIVMSGYDDFQYLQQAIRVGAVDYLLKPVDGRDLNSSLRKAIARIRGVSRNRAGAWGAPVFFAVRADLEEYVGLRKQLQSELLSLDRRAIRYMFGALKGFLKDRRSEVEQDGVLDRVYHDFVTIIEDFATEQRIEVETIQIGNSMGPRVGESRDQVDAIVDEIEGMCLALVARLEEERGRTATLDIGEVLRHIDLHFREAITLESLAGQFLVTKEHLSRKFKAGFGVTVSGHITAKRMSEARRLICDEGISIQRSAEMVGYQDLAYFYRVFKRHFGDTPAAVRAESLRTDQ